MDWRCVHTGSAHALHDVVKACLLMGASPLVRRLEYENAIAPAEHIVIPFKLIPVAPAHDATKARHRRCVLLDAGKAPGQHKRFSPASSIVSMAASNSRRAP